MEMDYNKIYNKILTDEEFMEIKQHGSSDYPFQYYYDNLELFDFHCIEWHWHREFEFLYVESGQVTCGIGEKKIILSEGEAIFINSKILHQFYASSDGVIPNFVCMPEFIAPENSLIYKKYILPIISSNISFQCFRINESWQVKIIQIMIKIMEIQENEKIRELATLALLQNLWLIFYENERRSQNCRSRQHRRCASLFFFWNRVFYQCCNLAKNDYGILQSGYYRSADSRCCHRRGPWCLGRCEPHGRVRKR